MTVKKRWIFITAISLGISLCLPLNLLGAGNFIVTPKIAVGWQADSNYWKSEDGEQEVFTYLIQPGIELGYETAKSLVSLNYTANAFFFDDQDSVPAGQCDMVVFLAWRSYSLPAELGGLCRGFSLLLQHQVSTSS